MYQVSRSSRFEVIDQLKVMRLQEDSPTYRCHDYIGNRHDEMDCDEIDCDEPGDSGKSDPNGLHPALSRPIDAECRSKMVQWCYQIVTFANFHRETVSIAMSYLDRFLSSNHPHARRAIANRKEYQLSCIAALYLAIKMNEPEEIDAKNFAELARGTHLECEIVRMEATILSVLDWRLSGPTSYSFLNYLLELGLTRMKSNTLQWNKITNLASYQIQLAVGDNFFVRYQPSIIAFASILNSLEPTHKNILTSDRLIFFQRIIDVTGIHPLSSTLWEVKNRLWAIVENGELLESLDLKVEKPTSKEHFHALALSRDPSPNCVSRSSKKLASSSIQTKRKIEFK